MTNEIKVGDKVRVSKDAPRMYITGLDHLFVGADCAVVRVEEDNATIQASNRRFLPIPTKYLVKVEDEAKEPRFKKGDRVRIKDGYYKEELYGCIGVIRRIDGCHLYVEIDSTIYPATIHSIEPYTEPTSPTIKVGDRVRNIESGLIGVVDNIVYRDVAWVYCMDGNRYNWKSNDLELVQPKEQTEAEKKPNIGSIKIPVEVDLTDSYWDAYTADLAHDIAVKIVNKNMGSDPEKVGEYAVKVAKAVAEGLKKK